MHPHVSSSVPRARYAGLDGLRAIAVLLVVVYHLFPDAWFVGGFVGVDVFFVISGFLITALLLRERADTGRVRLSGFWVRRARRLLPALALLVLVCSSAAWLIGGDVLVGLRMQLLGAATFSSNWLGIANGSDYFGAGGTELFRNLWSLGVEEQFYVLWPLLFPAVLLLRRRWLRATIALVLAGVSAAWMALVVTSGAGSPLTLGADVTRAYFGTDTHAFGLLMGVALAFDAQRAFDTPAAWMLRPTVRHSVTAVGSAAIAALGLVATLPETLTTATFPGSLVAASLLTALVIAAACWPGSLLGSALDVAPLRWIGERSYGLYLWHWPVLVLLVAAVQATGVDRTFPVWIGWAALAVSLLTCAVSYRFVELPLRTRGGLDRLRGALRPHAPRRRTTIAALAASALLIAGTTAAVATSPTVSSSQAVVDAGAAALEQEPSGERPLTTGESVRGEEVTAIGDSVMLASAPSLLEDFPGITVDAAVSRSMYAAPGILERLRDEGTLRPYVVVGLGTNGAISQETLSEILTIIGEDRQLILVNAFAPRSWIDGVNAELDAFGRSNPTVQIADWSEAIATHTDLLAADDVHPGDAGGQIFADAVADALVRSERAKARYAAFAEQRQYAEDLREDEYFRPVGTPHAS